MDVRTATAVAAAGLVLAASSGCGGSTTNDQQSYQVAESIDALVVNARAAAVTIEGGDGPVTVTEVYRFADEKPATSHRVEGSTLRLTDDGCRNDDVRCEVEFRVHLPAAARTEITAQAGAVKVIGLTGNVSISTQAGAVEGRALGGDSVTVSTQAGAATLEFAAAPSTVRASTELGAIEVRLPSGTGYAVDVQTTVGSSDVSVQRDPASRHKIEVRTGVGAVQVRNV